MSTSFLGECDEVQHICIGVPNQVKMKSSTNDNNMPKLLLYPKIH